MRHETGSNGVAMSSTAGLLGTLGRAVASTKTRSVVREQITETSWAEDFAAEQTRTLVRQVFFPGWPRPARQVVFSGVDDSEGVAAVALRVALELGRQVPAKVCAVEARRDSEAYGLSALAQVDSVDVGEQAAASDAPGLRIAKNLWLISEPEFRGRLQEELSVFGMRDRLLELRRSFEYAVICAAPALRCGETALLGHVADGVVLVLNAEETRRISAQKAKAVLQRSNARLVGIVLNRRSFPIPERLYRRL
jgi:protein-tyrosine kinase